MNKKEGFASLVKSQPNVFFIKTQNKNYRNVYFYHYLV